MVLSSPIQTIHFQKSRLDFVALTLEMIIKFKFEIEYQFGAFASNMRIVLCNFIRDSCQCYLLYYENADGKWFVIFVDNMEIHELGGIYSHGLDKYLHILQKLSWKMQKNARVLQMKYVFWFAHDIYYSPIMCISNNNPTNMIFMMLLFDVDSLLLVLTRLGWMFKKKFFFPFVFCVVRWLLLSITQIDLIPV